MNIKEQVELFTERYSQLQRERDDINKQTSEMLAEKLEEIKPIISTMLSNVLIFSHPQISEQTQHGAIVGYDSKFLFVYAGDLFLRIINRYNDEFADNSTVSIDFFACSCDIKFALKGIDHIKNYLESLLSDFSKENEERLSLSKKFKIEDYL